MSHPTHALPLRNTSVHHDKDAAKNALDIEEAIERRERLFAVEWRKRAHVFGRIALGTMFVLSGLAKAALQRSRKVTHLCSAEVDQVEITARDRDLGRA